MRQITEITYEYSPRSFATVKRGGCSYHVSGVTATIYKWMLVAFKEEAEQEFAEIFRGKKSSGLSPDTAAVTMEPAQAQ